MVMVMDKSMLWNQRSNHERFNCKEVGTNIILYSIYGQLSYP